jgi:hypothetical protein
MEIIGKASGNDMEIIGKQWGNREIIRKNVKYSGNNKKIIRTKYRNINEIMGNQKVNNWEIIGK